jgi:hypothetical protein
MTNRDAVALLWKHTRGLIFSLALGIYGGALCGAAILSLTGLAGRSGTTGTEYTGYWSVWEALVGCMYGAPLGAIAAPLAYLTIVRTSGFKRAFIPATLGTVLGGWAGSLLWPPLGMITGVVGFFLALLQVRYWRRNPAR